MTTPAAAPAALAPMTGVPASAAPAGADPLAGLHDIHLPQPVPFWPPAPGWWILAGLIVLALIAAAIYEWRRRQTLGYRALRALEAIEKDSEHYRDAHAAAAASALLIRRIVVTRFGRERLAGLTGDRWQTFLSEGKNGLPAEVSRLVAVAAYAPPGGAGVSVERATVFEAVRGWIRGNA
ncbi:DUF4381 domain-containing protein [Segnochrobactrum spirostomi]|uniref:DUF4381 domain-containing protein n=1 Tax=Segnochrobactrum spirostomi TaxID=2608987 RepID=A0A6A7Y9E1_9HYPH|nr:DUF4381 domain-containing protein [Segnochrobactrum spirostomi]MQT14987.1 DUF4381 domain-containing protein [Segnochrobactrum spirostomi]